MNSNRNTDAVPSIDDVEVRVGDPIAAHAALSVRRGDLVGLPNGRIYTVKEVEIVLGQPLLVIDGGERLAVQDVHAVYRNRR